MENVKLHFIVKPCLGVRLAMYDNGQWLYRGSDNDFAAHWALWNKGLLTREQLRSLKSINPLFDTDQVQGAGIITSSTRRRIPTYQSGEPRGE